MQCSVVLQEHSSLEEDLANTQQWAEDNQTSLFSYFIICILVNTDLVLSDNKRNVYIAQIEPNYHDSYRRNFPKHPVFTNRTTGTKL
ncbi:hypothetical protein NADRNF5_0387 [Nitrosopumilus adriaticus]|uniref:Uncharacterized protein n=1 Tax=Nitrosopumilus adriaticus TaxID=1580092 RepID=A0A0D5C0I1_9ARCH|nr:hypothetical protein NADRNF5_0387 [Nitrosopumilus adriaticus]